MLAQHVSPTLNRQGGGILTDARREDGLIAFAASSGLIQGVVSFVSTSHGVHSAQSVSRVSRG